MFGMLKEEDFMTFWLDTHQPIKGIAIQKSLMHW
jgi:hypothetical protein